ncbi:glycosyltransferase family 2 protein [Vibrio metschnikovii]|nr:glycosyltransferase family 2 protein [Vibrio metschnikovii]EKO3649906.1 glycosyltransferase family 2 protein [Vibrio metschnikovii]
MNTVNEKDLARIRKSDLFDPEWYLNNYPDVKKLGMDPALHFLKYGGLLRRDPSSKFSSAFHFDTRPGIENKGINPLVHYLGFKSGREPNKKNLLWAANNLLIRGLEQQAIDFLDENLPDDLSYTKNIILANQAINHRNEKDWLTYFNNYLSEFGCSPLSLMDNCGESILSRFYVNESPKFISGDLITVIMPAWNSQDTVYYAAKSILNQTWINIELIIVDDCSTDNTSNVLALLEKEDPRVKVIRNKINVGPYVSKNIALNHANGEYITGHDADDWAHPQRIEKHMELIISNNNPRASLTHMVRLKPSGHFGHISKISDFSFDGAARKASISCMFNKKFIKETLGYWDSVRFGADSEMISRAEKLLGDEFKNFQQIGMICLDLDTSLTNHPDHGIRSNNGGLSLSRQTYRDSWREWHDKYLDNNTAYLEFPLKNRKYDAELEMQVSYKDASSL